MQPAVAVMLHPAKLTTGAFLQISKVYTHYAATILFFFFGFKTLYDTYTNTDVSCPLLYCSDGENGAGCCQLAELGFWRAVHAVNKDQSVRLSSAAAHTPPWLCCCWWTAE